MISRDRIPHSSRFLSVASKSCIGNGLDRPASIPLLSAHSKFAFERASRSNAPIGFCQAAKIYNETCKIESYGHCGNKYEGHWWFGKCSRGPCIVLRQISPHLAMASDHKFILNDFILSRKKHRTECLRFTTAHLQN